MSERLRLCVLVTSSVTARSFLTGYLRFLREDGWDVTLICSAGPGVSDLAHDEGADFIPIEMARNPAPLRDLRALLELARVLRQLQPHVLVYATPKASLLGALAGRWVGVSRRVYELWGLRLETAAPLARYVLAIFEKITMSLSSVVIANSPSLAARANSLRLSGRRPISVLGSGSSHGVDTTFYSRNAQVPAPAPDFPSAHLPIVGFVGRMHPDKGVDTLLEALLLCANEGLEFGLVVVGENEGADYAAKAKLLSERIAVHLTGPVDDPRPYFRAMDVLVLPSRREGFPNVVLEAAAMGVPSIVSDATGCIDAVINGVTGLIVPVGDTSALASAVRDLANDSSRRARMGLAARRRAQAEFDSVSVWRAHSRLWRG